MRLLSFLDAGMILEILPCERQGPIYPAYWMNTLVVNVLATQGAKPSGPWHGDGDLVIPEH